MTNKKKYKSKKTPSKKELSPALLLTTDLLSVFFSLMPGVAAISLTLLFVFHGYVITWLVLPLAPFVLCATFIFIIATIRMCLPQLKPGKYKREMNKMTFAWFCHFALTRSAKITGLIPLIQTFNITKFLYWRALGAKVSFQIVNSFDIDFVDCPLITIGKNVTLGSGVSISCHSDVGNLLILAPVLIEDNVFVGMATAIGPATTIKKGCWIGYGNTFVNQVVEENTRLGNVRPTPDME